MPEVINMIMTATIKMFYLKEMILREDIRKI